MSSAEQKSADGIGNSFSLYFLLEDTILVIAKQDKKQNKVSQSDFSHSEAT